MVRACRPCSVVDLLGFTRFLVQTFASTTCAAPRLTALRSYMFAPLQNEALVPLDWEINGYIPDDDLNEILVRPLVAGERPLAQIANSQSDSQSISSPVPVKQPNATPSYDLPLNVFGDAVSLTSPPPFEATGVRLHCVIDACHSGTMLDLPFSIDKVWWTRQGQH